MKCRDQSLTTEILSSNRNEWAHDSHYERCSVATNEFVMCGPIVRVADDSITVNVNGQNDEFRWNISKLAETVGDEHEKGFLT